MKLMKLFILLCFLCSSQSFARNGSGGGDIVGNGGGLAEQNFIYALTHLPEFITETINNEPLHSEDLEQLELIKEIALTQYKKK